MSLTNILNPEQSHSNKQLPHFQPGTRKKLQYFSYDLSEIIGKGYSSQVFRGKNDLTNQPVAIKVIDMKMLKCQVNRTLLQNQIENLKALNKTPNILQLIEVYNTKNNTYIITQLCDSDLGKKIKKKMSEFDALNFLQQLIQGYLNLYRKEIIHRDLKPANVLLKDDQLKIADLGFSIKAKDALKPSRYNVGSPLYMAPESLKKNQYSYKSDIWALGVIFYEMIFHQPPWRAKNEKQLLKKIESQDIKTLILPNINPTIKQFLIKTLSFEKTQRMGPEQLQRFSFKNPQIHSQINLPINNNINKPFKQKYMNEQKFNNTLNPFLLDQTINNNNISDNLPKQRTHNRSPQKIEKRQASNRQNRKKIFDGAVMTTNTTHATNSEELRKQDRKQITKILISEVHFCRFLFKLNERIKKQAKLAKVSQELMDCYSNVVMDKITKVKDFQNFNFINTKYYEEYKTTSDFLKIKKIGKQYYIRYSDQINLNPQQIKYDIPKIIKSTQKIIKYLSKYLTDIVNHQNISEHSSQIIVLDYLITTYQLFGLIKQVQDYVRFARKSKIQQIVQGTPTNITINHFYKIMQKIQDLRL